MLSVIEWENKAEAEPEEHVEHPAPEKAAEISGDNNADHDLSVDTQEPEIKVTEEQLMGLNATIDILDHILDDFQCLFPETSHTLDHLCTT